MSTLTEELKVRGRLKLNALCRGEAFAVANAHTVAAKRRWPLPVEWKLHHALNLVAAEAGFRHWEHARRILSGAAQAGDDAGTLWYEESCITLLNHWFADYPAAKSFQRQAPQHYLFPYARQYVVGDANYVAALKLNASREQWERTGRDVAASYGTDHWRALCAARLNAIRLSRRSTA